MNKPAAPASKTLPTEPHGRAGTSTPIADAISRQATRIVRVTVPGDRDERRSLGRPTTAEQPAKPDTDSPYADQTLEEFIHREVPRLVERQLPNSPLIHVVLNKKLLIGGLWLEFGVYQGNTITILGRYAEQTVYGFDSFRGLPEDWRPGKTKGRYDLQRDMPDVPDNVRLIPGWFEDTLPPFLEQHPGNVALLHVDCDIYSSTKTVLTLLRNRIVAGTVIVFDELFNYPEYREHELKAFFEFLAETGARFEWIGMKGTIEIDPDEEFEHEFYKRSTGMGVRITSMPRNLHAHPLYDDDAPRGSSQAPLKDALREEHRSE